MDPLLHTSLLLFKRLFLFTPNLTVQSLGFRWKHMRDFSSLSLMLIAIKNLWLVFVQATGGYDISSTVPSRFLCPLSSFSSLRKRRGLQGKCDTSLRCPLQEARANVSTP